MDSADWQRDLDRTCALFLDRSPDGDVDAFREKLDSAFEGHRWVFREDRTYEKISGAMPTFGTYEIYGSGADFIVYRLFPDPALDQSLGIGLQELNTMNMPELAQEIGMRNGPAPFLVGFEFVSKVQVRGFAVQLDQDKLITDERDYAHLYNLAR